MAAKNDFFFNFRKWDCISQNRQCLCVVLTVFGKCKVDVNGMGIILTRRDEMNQGVSTPSGVVKSNLLIEGELCVKTNQIS